MNYYFSKKIKGSFDEVLERVTSSLKKEGL